MLRKKGGGMAAALQGALRALKESEMFDWPHAPTHRCTNQGTYMVTAATYQKEPIFRGADRLDFLLKALLFWAQETHWDLEAWALFPNHYHLIVQSTARSTPLKDFISQLHSHTAREINGADDTPGRKVWHQFWDTHLTNQTSYLARLNYVHRNPEKHGVVGHAANYRWCSRAWLERVSKTSFVKTLDRFDIEKVKVTDDY